MQFFKKLWNNETFKISILISLLFLVMCVLVGHEMPSIGAIINSFNPCDDTILNSLYLHCYSSYDWSFCLVTGTISSISFLVAVIAGIYLSVKKVNE